MSVRETWNMECPECKSDEHLEVTVQISARLTGEGTILIDGDHEWDENSYCFCRRCFWGESAATFQIKVDEAQE